MDTPTIDELRDSLEAAVIEAYDMGRDELDEFEDAPTLEAVYDNFVANTQDNIIEDYQEFFGEGTTPRMDWAYDIGLDPAGIPDMLTVCRILNMFKLPYVYDGVLYNHITRRLLPEPEKIEEDVL